MTTQSGSPRARARGTSRNPCSSEMAPLLGPCSQTTPPGIKGSGKPAPLLFRSEETWARNSVPPSPAQHADIS